MAEQTIKLGDIIGLEIPANKKWTCLAKTKQQRRCQHVVATSKCDKARAILQHKMTFQESEHDLIGFHIKQLVNLLFHNGIQHPNIKGQMKEQETKWLDLWRAELKHRAESNGSAADVDEPEQFPSEGAMTQYHEPDAIAQLPANVGYPTLPLETSQVPTDTSFHTTAIASYLNRTVTLDITEDVSDQRAEVATASQPSVVGYDGPLAPNQTSSHESLGLTVFFSPNQLEMINIILHFGLQLCAFFQIQYGTFISRDGAGNKRTESRLRFKLIFGMDLTLSEILTSPWAIFPLFVALGQFMYVLIGPWSSFMLFLFVALVGSCWTGTQDKAVVRRTERV
ncbi:uncharacterized protein N7503_000524 [Penicillium pulvis]|uniref:uncharacterized protein n=1 Tax=Penicillium pulvis TaxID=1562058 RepID=UPI002546642D|nr:uncharacterized protein N7503_000524 [Penicillium pulvis]KAJ5813774.1 hypothetical protein N7503_000524 [Penicillium pulvis]